jgi:hypothetical protein
MEYTIHDQLMKELRSYFEAHQDWEMNQTHASGIRARQSLVKIRQLARDRRAEIQAIRSTKPKIKSPAYRQSLLKDQGLDDAN